MMAIPDERRQVLTSVGQADGSRRLVVELRDMPVELVSKRVAKALLAQRLRPVAHIQGARPEQGGGRADDRNGEIPAGERIVMG